MSWFSGYNRLYEQETMIQVVEKIAEVLTIPFTVGRDRSYRQVANLLRAGADKYR